eukprot:scaffold27843_cov61-Skeletonema_dohrnii-CCMP3373.AAC.1
MVSQEASQPQGALSIFFFSKEFNNIISCIARSSAVMVGGHGIHGHDGYGYGFMVDVDDGMENYQADGLVDITATAAGGRDCHGALASQKRVPGGQEKVSGGKRPQLLSQPGTQCGTSVGVTANPKTLVPDPI